MIFHSTTGRYAYIATADFPYIMACFRGLKYGEDTCEVEERRRKRQDRPPPPGDAPVMGGGGGVSQCIANCENPALGCETIIDSNDGDVTREPDENDGNDGVIGDGSPLPGENSSERVQLSVSVLLLCIANLLKMY